MKRVSTINTIMFVAFLGIFGLVNILTPVKAFSEMENRYLAQLPTINLRNLKLGRVTSGIESFVTDQFFLRSQWVLVKSDLERLTLKRENNGIFIGRNGFLLEHYKGPTDNLYKNIGNINNLKAMLPELNFYFMAIPNSTEVLDHNLPTFATPHSQREVMDIVSSNLDSRVVFIDVTNALSEVKDQYIYFKTDHHWTMEGAYWAYNYASSYLGYRAHGFHSFRKNLVADDFLGTYYSKTNNRNVKPDEIFALIPEFPTEYSVQYSGSNEVYDQLFSPKHLNGRDKYSYFLDGNHPLVTIKSHATGSDKLLIIKDSYAHSMVPFLANHYSEIHMVDLRYFNSSLSRYISENQISDVLLLFNISTFSREGNIMNFIS